MPKTISKICAELNNLAKNHDIGDLQNIRSKINGRRKATSKIFNKKSIWEDYAFNLGGRTELQFNIGFVNNDFRYGIAFSFQESQTLPVPSKLLPLVKRLNEIIQLNHDFFEDYKMAVWNDGWKSVTEVKIIDESHIKNHDFVFIGKIVPEYTSADDVLSVFDKFLGIYIKVMNQKDKIDQIMNYFLEKNESKFELNFDSKKEVLLPKKRILNQSENHKEIEIMHTKIQQKLLDELISEYGNQNVFPELHKGIQRIDIMVKDGTHVYFYEVKTASSARECIRQAFGQVMDYAYYPNIEKAQKMIIAGTGELTDNDKLYLNFIKKRFKLKLEYRRVQI